MGEVSASDLKETPLHALHVELGARMVPFAGYDMPVQYPAGILTEHNHTRAQAGLFDVSHMGQARLWGAGADKAMETIVPGNLTGLALGRIRYTVFTNDQGGILDDLTIGRAGDHLSIVVNAACKDQDYAHMRAKLPKSMRLEVLEDRALLALQGPAAEKVMARFAPDAAKLGFMSFTSMKVAGLDCAVFRSGYTGEDGYEISVASKDADAFARKLLKEPEVKPIGLGARDSLRLEAGLCLYGHDLDTTTTPAEGDIGWTIAKRRREEGGFPGDTIILKQLAEGPARVRVGIRPDGRAPAREGTKILDAKGKEIGVITSGGFGPTANGPVAMGYVTRGNNAVGTQLGLVVRGTTLAAKVAALPFVPHRYKKAIQAK
ncbi:MAG: glycine cleavage system aminomethyltransferase GcvT [Alphaproteobacteria bacterium]|nr:glycine cleavage system aminomethyltransferase GcvT [Alphaproteobacteria bacterium]